MGPSCSASALKLAKIERTGKHARARVSELLRAFVVVWSLSACAVQSAHVAQSIHHWQLGRRRVGASAVFAWFLVTGSLARDDCSRCALRAGPPVALLDW